MRGKTRAVWSLVLGMVATITLPAAILATRYSNSYDLLYGGLVIPVVVVAGIGAIVLARQARARERATVTREGRGRVSAWGRILGVIGLCLAASGAISLAVYAVLVSAD